MIDNQEEEYSLISEVLTEEEDPCLLVAVVPEDKYEKLQHFKNRTGKPFYQLMAEMINRALDKFLEENSESIDSSQKENLTAKTGLNEETIEGKISDREDLIRFLENLADLERPNLKISLEITDPD